MALTFPIDKKPLEAIPQLCEILECFPSREGYIKYVCFLYDPKNLEVKQASTMALRRALAAEFAGCTPPEAPLPDEEPSLDFLEFGRITSMVFSRFNNFGWQLVKSREVVLERMMDILMSVEEGADATKQIKIWAEADKAIEDTMLRYDALIAKMAMEDDRIITAFKSARGDVKRQSISPEKMGARKT